jgi:hypothetical protein
MTQDTKVAEKTCSIPTFERNRYFFGKPMTVHDFDAEQQYGIGKNRLLNRLIHGSGILCGMQLSKETIADGKFTVEISEGAALDCCGNLIVANRTETVEVQGSLVDGENYLYVKFAECVRQPIMASANVSSCEEVCCYNRIRETFEVFAAPGPAASSSFTGAVKRSDAQGIIGARVEALQQGIVRSATLTNNTGNFTLEIPTSVVASQFDVRASATGFSAVTKVNQTASTTPLSDFVLTPQPEGAPASVCKEVTQHYFDEHSRLCPRCDDPRVFLAVANVTEGTVTIDQTKTARVRSIIYSNPMLHDLFCDHLADFNNPHRTTAEQILALQSINNVGNGPGRKYTANINVASSDTTIGITPDPTMGTTPDRDSPKIDLKLASDAVKPIHLHNDTINSLLASDGTITITPDTANKRIAIKTTPAASVSSVGTSKSIGASIRYAREDHVHDLTDRIVTKAKFAEEVVNTLLASDGTITITPDLGSRQIRVRTTPATEVSNVGAARSVGASLKFAREDHVHRLQINERGPDANGLFRLTPGANVSIDGGVANELVISAQLKITTGLVRFDAVEIQERRPSPPILHGLKAKNFAIVLGLVRDEKQNEAQALVEIGELRFASPVRIGELVFARPDNPLLVAAYQQGEATFAIMLQDNHQPSNIAKLAPTTYFVRWWAIPFSDEMELVVSHPVQPPIPITDPAK